MFSAQAGGVEVLSDILGSGNRRSAKELADAVSVLAQITAPWIDDNHVVTGLDKHLETFVSSLTRKYINELRRRYGTLVGLDHGSVVTTKHETPGKGRARYSSSLPFITLDFPTRRSVPPRVPYHSADVRGFTNASENDNRSISSAY